MRRKQLQSITETPNELTTDIDLADAVGICRLFRQTDSQIFNGWRHYPALSDKEIIEKIKLAVLRIARVLKSGGTKRIIISGAGTSGRLSMFSARSFNSLMRDYAQKPIFDYLIAGTNKALIKAQEGAEDDPHQAVVELKQKVGNAKHVVYIGVTCGFSAAYIAGQLDFTTRQKNYFSILLGFNPVERARNVPIEGWDKTFYDVVQNIKDLPDCLILNPVLGPEPITGSTRMKGGSATKLILEIVFTLALVEAGIIPRKRFLIPALRKNTDIIEDIKTFLSIYEQTRVETYEIINPISEAMELAGNALRHKAHIYYLGIGPFGVLGTIDASECPPTFGADFEDVRGFIKDGWHWMLDGADDSELVNCGEPYYRIDFAEFEKQKLPHLGKNDLVIGIAYDTKHLQQLLPYIKQARKKSAHTVLILIQSESLGKRIRNLFDVVIMPELTYLAPIRGYPFFGQLALKLILNAITTGAHIFSGKIYQNRMIDLRISNNKLFYRTLGILNTILGIDRKTAKRCVISAIYHQDNPPTTLMRRPISVHVNAATNQEKIVPLAILLGTGKFNVKRATEIIQRVPIIRTIVEKYR
ncbi:hypothetical protein J7M23_03035 [Candidatus Sumerlaeota bacterium]|nr:hypothetical protein [Candidatus Sumerlaeota bacterium]